MFANGSIGLFLTNKPAKQGGSDVMWHAPWTLINLGTHSVYTVYETYVNTPFLNPLLHTTALCPPFKKVVQNN